MDITITVTEAEARRLQDRFRDLGAQHAPDSFEGKVLREIETKLPSKYAACPDCRRGEYTDYHVLTNHLINVHNYENNEYGEDTAQSNAWMALSRAGLNPPRYA